MYDVNDIIFEKYNEGKISDEDKLLMLLEASSEEKTEIKRIKEKVKNKEELTDSEEKKYKEYKKRRNIKIGVGVGIGVAMGASIAKKRSQTNTKIEQVKKKYADAVVNYLDYKSRAHDLRDESKCVNDPDMNLKLSAKAKKYEDMRDMYQDEMNGYMKILNDFGADIPTVKNI